MGDCQWHGERGQLILIAGLILGILLVSLALILNSAIFTENLATRSGVQTTDATAIRASTTAATTGAMRLANYGTPEAPYADRKAAVEANLSAWQELQTTHHAVDGGIATGQPTSMTEGVRVSQQSADELDPADPDVIYELNPLGLTGQNWLVAKSVKTRHFSVNLSRSSLSDTDLSLLDLLDPEDAFSIHIEDADGHEWRVLVYRSTADLDQVNVTVAADTGGGWNRIGTCSQTTPELRVNVTDGTIIGSAGEQACPALLFTEDVDPPYDVYYVNGDDVIGTYGFIANESETTFRDEVEAENQGLLDALGGILVGGTLITDILETHIYYDDPAAGDPYTTTAVYDTEVDVSLRTERLTYKGAVLVAPGEPDYET